VETLKRRFADWRARPSRKGPSQRRGSADRPGNPPEDLFHRGDESSQRCRKPENEGWGSGSHGVLSRRFRHILSVSLPKPMVRPADRGPGQAAMVGTGVIGVRE
jgi:hypothetical protein